MTVSQTALIVTSNEQIFTFWDHTGSIKLMMFYSNIEKNRIEVGVIGEPPEQLDKPKSADNPYQSYFDRYGNNPFQKDAGFLLGLVKKNATDDGKCTYILTVTVGCRMKTWNFPSKSVGLPIFGVKLSGVDTLTQAFVHY